MGISKFPSKAFTSLNLLQSIVLVMTIVNQKSPKYFKGNKKTASDELAVELLF
ncbi:hypothetical protein GCM10008025_35370 [Ornithinibacillus halotolerans]|uniref:Uncharacterized protein n=1 Tax=Ornithinibacillus halotolerans TaxID=1274357 RepID=A0A916WE13_9BACI|nr:hypothetical protein GCM10008025_35370 [Ornithinibacillus halotolerans]